MLDLHLDAWYFRRQLHSTFFLDGPQGNPKLGKLAASLAYKTPADINPLCKCESGENILQTRYFGDSNAHGTLSKCMRE